MSLIAQLRTAAAARVPEERSSLMPPIPRPMLSVADVAAVVGLSEYTIRDAIRDGELPASKLRGRIRIHPEDVDAWIERSKIRPSGAAGARPRGNDGIGAAAGRGIQPDVATPENIQALIARARKGIG